MKSNTPSILFMGTPVFASHILKGLWNSNFNVVGVITRPDTSKGRSSIKSASAVKIEAKNYNIPIFQPENKDELTEVVKNIKPELIVIAAFGMIVPAEVLKIPRYGTLNIHGSLLPKYRGASPITEALLNGDDKTGITIMQVSPGMDEGDMISSYELRIKDEDTTASLTEKMAELGSKAIIETIPDWILGNLKTIPQDDNKATYCRKITKEDGHIDWNQPAEKIERMIRAYTPWPTAFTFANNLRIKIMKAGWIPVWSLPSTPIGGPGMTRGALQFESGHIYIGTSSGILEILELQPEGKKPMSAHDFINGNKGLDGVKLT